MIQADLWVWFVGGPLLLGVIYFAKVSRDWQKKRQDVRGKEKKGKRIAEQLHAELTSIEFATGPEIRFERFHATVFDTVAADIDGFLPDDLVNDLLSYYENMKEVQAHRLKSPRVGWPYLQRLLCRLPETRGDLCSRLQHFVNAD